MSLSHKSRRKAGLLILAVTGLLAVTPMLSGCGGSGREEALKQAVYVGTGGYDPALSLIHIFLFKGNHVLEATCDKKTRNVTFLIPFLNKLDSYNIMVFRTYFLSFGIL